jgi:hypothetical protein
VQKLHLVGFTTDQKGLILSARRGTRSGSYHVTVDDELAEAVEELRAKQAEAEAEAEVEAARPARVESALSVKEIQARLRQGRALNEVAKAAGVDPEWVERFAAPVFAERAQVIALVQARPLKRARLGASSHPIGEALRRNLAERGVSISPEEFNDGWSARQLADGRWAVRFRYHHRSRDHVLRFDLDEATGAVVAADRASGQLGYVTPPERPTAKVARPKPAPAPAPPQGDRPPKRATVTVGFRPDAGGATSPAARERERASEAMRKAAAQRAVEAEKAAARRAREREEREARLERERQVAEARRLREEQAAEARRAREQAAKERARAIEARKKAAAAKRLADQRAKEKAAKERKAAAAAKKRAAERAKAKAAKQRADQAKRAEAALRAAERRAAAASKKKTSSGTRKATPKKASTTKGPTKKATRPAASKSATRAAAAVAKKTTAPRAAAKSATKATAAPATKAPAAKAAKAPTAVPPAKVAAAKAEAAPGANVPPAAPVVEAPATAEVPGAATSPTPRPAEAAAKPLFAPGALRPVPPPVPPVSAPLDDDATGDVRILGPAPREPDGPRAPAAPTTTTPLLFRAGVVEATSDDGDDRPHPAAVLGSGGNGRARARPPGARRTRPLRAT